MRLLHFRRTFVEKLFAIHKRVELLKRDGTPIGPHARHYYDLSRLANRSEVRHMLESPEYAAIRSDYKAVSLAYFPDHYFEPDGQRFKNSAAIFPSTELARVLGSAYEQQCRMLCYGPYPTRGRPARELRGVARRPLSFARQRGRTEAGASSPTKRRTSATARERSSFTTMWS